MERILLAFCFVVVAIINTINAYKTYKQKPEKMKNASILYVAFTWFFALIGVSVNIFFYMNM